MGLGLVSGIGYLAFRFAGNPTSFGERAVAAVLFVAFCLMAVIAGIALLQQVADGANPAWRTLASNAHGIYDVHPLILYPLAYLLLDLDAPAIVKVTVLVVVTLGASLRVSALVLRRLPGLRRVF